MKFLLLSLVICFALLLAAVHAVPIDESIPEGLDGGSYNDVVSPSEDHSILLKLKLLKKLLFLG